MGLPLKLADIAPRVATGAYILNSGLEKRSLDEGQAKGLHGMASGAYPFLSKVDPKTFARLLSTGEIVLGAALLAPVVPTAAAGAGLAAFATGLVGLYLRTPGLRKEGSLAPSEQGKGLAKDVWILGIGLGFVIDELAERSQRSR
jgi:hypothetical protein